MERSSDAKQKASVSVSVAVGKLQGALKGTVGERKHTHPPHVAPCTHVDNAVIGGHKVVRPPPPKGGGIGPRRSPAEARRFLQWQKERRKRDIFE